MPRRFVLISVLLLGLLLSGCGRLGYYGQSVSGHLAIMADSRPIDEMLADPQVDAELKQKLQRALEFRRFASAELYLPENDSYRSYTDTGRSAAVWNVVAAPADALTAEQWCFLFVGCLPYRGYYDKAEAEAFAAGLEAEGLDVLTYGVPAYSTLGWFDDPLLNTLIDLPEWALAGIIFHELAHQLVYVDDDSTFNEAFAQLVEEEGRRRWLERYGSAGDHQSFADFSRREEGFRALMGRTRQALLACYAGDRPRDARLACKHRSIDQMLEEYAALKQQWDGFAGYDRWLLPRPNNAHFVSEQTYRHYVPAFAVLLRRAGGDLRRFYAEVERLAELSQQQRLQEMEQLLEATAADGSEPGRPAE